MPGAVSLLWHKRGLSFCPICPLLAPLGSPSCPHLPLPRPWAVSEGSGLGLAELCKAREPADLGQQGLPASNEEVVCPLILGCLWRQVAAQPGRGSGDRKHNRCPWLRKALHLSCVSSALWFVRSSRWLCSCFQHDCLPHPPPFASPEASVMTPRTHHLEQANTRQCREAQQPECFQLPVLLRASGKLLPWCSSLPMSSVKLQACLLSWSSTAPCLLLNAMYLQSSPRVCCPGAGCHSLLGRDTWPTAGLLLTAAFLVDRPAEGPRRPRVAGMGVFAGYCQLSPEPLPLSEGW